MLLSPAKYIVAIGITDDTSLDKTEWHFFHTLVFFKTHFSVKADNTPTEKNWFADSLANMERGFYIDKILAESLISS